MGGNKKQDKQYPEEKVPALNNRKRKKSKGKLFKGPCNKCGKYGHRASYFQANKNKNDRNPVSTENSEIVRKGPQGGWLLAEE